MSGGVARSDTCGFSPARRTIENDREACSREHRLGDSRRGGGTHSSLAENTMSFEERCAQAYARHVNEGRKIIIQCNAPLVLGYTIPHLKNSWGMIWEQPFTVVRETSRGEWISEMSPILEQVGYHHEFVGPAFYYEVIAD
jgi:hypothetical protein